jgi:hypothetical protein
MYFQELISEQKKINSSDMYWSQIVTNLNKRGRADIHCHNENKNRIIYLGHIFQYIPKKSLVNNECPVSGPNEWALGNYYFVAVFCLLSSCLTIPTTSSCFFCKQAYFSLAWYIIVRISARQTVVTTNLFKNGVQC